jgi:hypothetical protein
VAVVSILLATITAIAQSLLPADNRSVRIVLLVLMFLFVAVSFAVVLNYFGHLRIGIVGGVAISALVTSLFGYYTWPAPRPIPQNDFSVEVRSALVCDSSPVAFYMVSYPSSFGFTASPVLYLAFLRITNNQDSASTIGKLLVAVSNDPDGPWEELVQIPLTSMALYQLGDGRVPIPKLLVIDTTFHVDGTKPENLKYAMGIVANPMLERELANPIDPHMLCSGWAAFDVRSHKTLPLGPIYFRVVLRDNNNRGGTFTTALPQQQIVGSDVGKLEVLGTVTDISSFHLKYYSDPFPVPTPAR